MDMRNLRFTNTQGIHMQARLVLFGDLIGDDTNIPYEAYEPLVELYDTAYDHTPYGMLIWQHTLSYVSSMMSLGIIDDTYPEYALCPTEVREMHQHFVEYLRNVEGRWHVQVTMVLDHQPYMGVTEVMNRVAEMLGLPPQDISVTPIKFVTMMEG